MLESERTARGTATDRETGAIVKGRERERKREREERKRRKKGRSDRGWPVGGQRWGGRRGR